MKTTKTATFYCPSCGIHLNRITNINGDDAAHPDCISICIHCYTILMHTNVTEPRIMTEEEVNQLPEDQQSTIRQTVLLLMAVRDGDIDAET